MFRPCIDLRDGRVVQIVGGTLSDDPSLHAATTTHHVSDLPAEWFASRYRDDSLAGGHVIMLGAGNESSARRAVAAWPGGMQVGGGISVDNAHSWLNAGASHVIVTSWLFVNGELSSDRLAAMVAAVGSERLVIDLSCRRRDGAYWVVTDRWQRFTSLQVTAEVLAAPGNEPVVKPLVQRLGKVRPRRRAQRGVLAGDVPVIPDEAIRIRAPRIGELAVERPAQRGGFRREPIDDDHATGHRRSIARHAPPQQLAVERLAVEIEHLRGIGAVAIARG